MNRLTPEQQSLSHYREKMAEGREMMEFRRAVLEVTELPIDRLVARVKQRVQEFREDWQQGNYNYTKRHADLLAAMRGEVTVVPVVNPDKASAMSAAAIADARQPGEPVYQPRPAEPIAIHMSELPANLQFVSKAPDLT